MPKRTATTALAAETGRATPCPEWCTDCEGWRVDGPGTAHVRKWNLTNGTQVELCLIHSDLGSTEKELWIEIPSREMSSAELLALADAISEAAEIVDRHDLGPIPVTGTT